MEDHLSNDIEVPSVDSYCIKSIQLFYDQEYGFPKELYKGEDRNYIENFIYNIVRDLKIVFAELCRKKPDKNIANIENNARDTTIAFFVNSLCQKTGLDNFFVQLYVYSIIQYCRIKAMVRICAAIEE